METQDLNLNKEESSIASVIGLYEQLLNKHYVGPNAYKVIALFRSWVVDTYSKYHSGGEEELVALSEKLRTTNVGLNIAVDDRFVNRKRQAPAKKSDYKERLKSILGWCFLKFGGNILVLSGGQNLLSRKRFIFSQFVLQRLKPGEVDLSLLNAFREEIKSIPNLEDSYKTFLLDNLPMNFFLEGSQRVFGKKELLILCSPSTFLANIDLIQLLISDTKIRIFGIQHGANYGLFKTNYFEETERALSDRFFYWYFGKDAILVNRFEETKTVSNELSEFKFIWIGRGEINDYVADRIPALRPHFATIENVNVLNELLDASSNTSFRLIPHQHKFKNDPYKSVELALKFRPSAKIEHYILPDRHILVFDVLMSTTIFYAMAKRIPFLVFCEPFSPDETTARFKEFESWLRKNSLLFYLNEYEQMTLELEKYKEEPNYHKSKRNMMEKEIDILKKGFVNVPDFLASLHN